MLPRLDPTRRLLHEAVRGVTDLVARSHDQVAAQGVSAARRAGLGAEAEAIDGLRRAVTWSSLAGVRGANRLVERLGDAAMTFAPPPPAPGLPPLRSDGLRGAAGLVDGAVGALNGVFGDGLVARGNGLDLGLALRLGDALLPAEPALLAAALAPALEATREVLVFVHGLAATEWSWCLGGAAHWGDVTASFATRLQAERGAVPLLARYNTGRPITENGAALHAWLGRVTAAASAAGRPIERVVLIGHSLGGLVVRDAVARAATADSPWFGKLKACACLGSPHRGAPLERAAHALAGTLARLPTPGAQVPATLLNLRSAAIRELGLGDGARPAAAPWHGPDLPAAPGLRWLLVASTLTARPAGLGALLGDGLVPIASATGPAANRPDVQVAVIPGVAHAAMQNHPAVYTALRAWLAETSAEGHS